MSTINQFTIRGQNKEGVLADIIQYLGYEGVNIRSIMIFNIGNEGEIRLVVNDPIKAERVFKENNINYSIDEVLAVKMPDKPGALHHIASILSRNKINIEYIYSLIVSSSNATVIFKTKDLAQTEKILHEHEILTVAETEI